MKSKTVILVVLLVGTVVAVVPGAEAQVQPCDPPRSEVDEVGNQYYTAGYSQPSGVLGQDYVEGTGGSIVTRFPNVCRNQNGQIELSNNTSIGAIESWSLNPNLPGKIVWADAGFIRYPGSSSLTNFTQHTWNGNNVTTQNWGTVSSGVTQSYRVQWTAGTCYCYQFFINGALKTNTTWDPFDYWASPFTSYWGGKAQRLNTDVAGSAANPMRFTLLKVQDFLNHNFEDADPSPPPPQFVFENSNVARWEVGGVAGLAFNVYCETSCGS